MRAETSLSMETRQKTHHTLKWIEIYFVDAYRKNNIFMCKNDIYSVSKRCTAIRAMQSRRFRLEPAWCCDDKMKLQIVMIVGCYGTQNNADLLRSMLA